MRVLLVGNTGYITKEFVQEAFPESEVFIMGNSLLKTEAFDRAPISRAR